MLKTYSIKYIFFCCFFLLSPMAYGEICLVLMIHNDELVIERTLDSVKDVIDCICVCNVNSDDDTLPLLHAFKQNTNIPIKVVQQENKHQDPYSCAIQAGRRMLEKSKCNLSSSYLLFLDAGTMLSHGHLLKERKLSKDAYFCVDTKESLGFSRRGLHLLKASLSWENQGRLYPIWTTDEDFTSEQLDDIRIQDVYDEQYIKMNIKQKIDAWKGSADPETLFYLAQAHKAQHKFELAIHLHQNHIEQGTDREQVWFSHLMIAECYEAKDEWEMALEWYLKAYEFYPERAEPLRKLAVHYRQRGHNHVAYLFAKQGTRIHAPSDQALWTIPELKPYQFDEELSIAAYYTQYQEEGEAAANDLLIRKEVPWFLKEQTYKNLLFYAKRLEDIHHFPIDFDLPRIQDGEEESYHPMNPSICKTDEGYQVVCRTVNYTQEGAKTFHTSDPSGVFRTRNFLLNFDRNFRLLSQKEIIENLPRKRIRSFNLEGLDDCRIFTFNKEMWFSCNTGDTNPFGNFQISLCKLGDSSQKFHINVDKLIPLLGPDPYRCEKNWLPFVKDDLVHFIYSYDPFIIYTPDMRTGHCEKKMEHHPEFDFSHFRGSAGPIAFDDGYLLLVHEVVLQSDYSRCYLHRFLYTDENFFITKISKPFFFAHHGVEYCCSITLDHSTKQLVAPIGIEDREAYLYFFDCDMIRSLLHPLKSKDSRVFS